MANTNGHNEQEPFSDEIRATLEQLPDPPHGEVELTPEVMARFDGETLSYKDEAVYDFVEFCRRLSYEVRSVEEAEILWETELGPRLRSLVGPDAFFLRLLRLPESEARVADYARHVLLEGVKERRTI